MNNKIRRAALVGSALTLIAIVFVAALPATAQEGPKFTLGGTTYTKWLWGNQRYDGSVYNFTTVPGEGYGDNGQGSEVELLLNAKLSRAVEVKARLHSRFNQNQWTNFGGFGGAGAFQNFAQGNGDCTGGACGEFDPRSNQYVKLRGVAVTLTPGYKWIDSATIGANDFGQFDPFVIGRIRYIDRDNAAGLLFQGSAMNRQFTWDATRISLPRLWAGPSFNTGVYAAADAAYGLQMKYTVSPLADFGGIVQWVNDIEVDGTDRNVDNGRSTRTRFRNTVIGVKGGLHLSSAVDMRAAYYHSTSESSDILAPANFGLAGFSPTLPGSHRDWSGKVNVDLNDPFGVGLSFSLEGFSIGKEYVSMMAARRESDVLLTEGHDGSFAFPGPSNAAFGVFGGNPTRIGYGGWDGNAVQVATINVDNEFTDFDEQIAETVIGWKGFTIVPRFGKGGLDIQGEYSYITYNTNWQAFGDITRSITSNLFPTHEGDTGVGHNFRSAYAPFQDKKTHIAAANVKYVLDVGKGIDLFGKLKFINETDERMNDVTFLPYLAGACPTTGTLGCSKDSAGNFNRQNRYYRDLTTSEVYTNPPVITVRGVTGYQWKPFSSLADDDRNLNYFVFNMGAGYQLTDDLYASAGFTHYNARLLDGTTAFQAYNLHEMAGGQHRKNQVAVKGKYILAGAEIGFEWQYNFGTFTPDFGDGFVVQFADDATSRSNNVPVGSRGFRGRFGGWNSLEKREFNNSRLKAFLKVQF